MNNMRLLMLFVFLLSISSTLSTDPDLSILSVSARLISPPSALHFFLSHQFNPSLAFLSLSQNFFLSLKFSRTLLILPCSHIFFSQPCCHFFLPVQPLYFLLLCHNFFVSLSLSSSRCILFFTLHSRILSIFSLSHLLSFFF